MLCTFDTIVVILPGRNIFLKSINIFQKSSTNVELIPWRSVTMIDFYMIFVQCAMLFDYSVNQKLVAKINALILSWNFVK